MSVSSNFLSWKIQYSISPIILTGGLATAQGGAIPIVSITNPGDSLSQVSDASNAQLDGLFATYRVMAGGTFINNRVGTYPFANQAIAANAIIADPLTISVAMICPAGNQGGYSTKSSLMTTLLSTLALHNNLGGTYSVVTVSKIYINCILTGMRDISGAESNQTQHTFQLDFYQPLVSQAAATAALNGLMTKMSNGTPIMGTPNWATGSPVTNPSQVQGLVPQTQLMGSP
jgi:hypothetical protein